MIIASIIFGCIAVFSWFSYLTVFFQDVRFTPHFMRTVINHNNMTLEQANDYLDSLIEKYKTRLSYGNISNKECNSIEATFELLYKEYKLPEPIHIDEKNEVILSNLSDIKQTVIQTNNGIDKVTTHVEAISTYTNKKQLEEDTEAIRIEELQISSNERFITAYERQRGCNLPSFLPKLSEIQLDILTKYCNLIPVFNRDIEKAEIKNILLCTHKSPLKVKINKHIALLFTRLYEEGLICSTWKAVATRHKCFISAKDKYLNSNDLCMGNSTSGLIDPNINN